MLCKLLCAGIQSFNHSWCGSFLGSKHVGCTIWTIERVRHIACQYDFTTVKSGLNILEISFRGKGFNQSTKHAYACIACGTATQSDNHFVAATAQCIGNKKSCAIRGGTHGVALFRLNAHESACLCYLYDCCAAVSDAILRLNPPHQGIAGWHRKALGSRGFAESFEHTVATI